MKKILCLFLAAVMIVGFCGCKENKKDIVSSNSSQTASQEQKEAEFALGKTENNTYTNDFLEASCTLPEGWAFYTKEQILSLNNIVGDVVDEEIADRIKNANLIYDMYATNQTDGSSININLEKMNVALSANVDIKKVLESQIDIIKNTYQNMGYTDTSVDYQKVTVGGKELDSLKITAKIQGNDFYAVAFTFRKGNYLANTTVCSLKEDKTNEILGYFTIK